MEGDRLPDQGQSLTYARGDSVTVETTALTVLAMLKTGQFTNSVNKALTYLIKSKRADGTWGSTSATILSLKALVAGMGGRQAEGQGARSPSWSTARRRRKGEVTRGKRRRDAGLRPEGRAPRPAPTRSRSRSNGETNLMYQIVGRHYEPWKKDSRPPKPVLDVDVDYDRTKLSTEGPAARRRRR